MSAAEDFARLVRWVCRDVTYHRLYPAEVEHDNGNNTVDVRIDDGTTLGGSMQHVPIRPGVAGTGMRLERGARCLVGFEDGDPQRPYIAAWVYAKSTGTVLLDGGDAAVARKGDLITINTLPVMAVTGVASGEVTNPSPPPLTLPVPPPPALTVPFIGTITLATPVVAQPIGGARRILA